MRTPEIWIGHGIWVAVVCTLAVSPGSSLEITPCRVGVVIREDGGAPPASSADTVHILGTNQSAMVALNITNWGQIQEFTVKLEPVGVQIMDGPLSRSITIAAGTSQYLRVSLRAGNLRSGSCYEDSRQLGATVFSKNEPGRICGISVKNFSCTSFEAAIPVQVATTPPLSDSAEIVRYFPQSGRIVPPSRGDSLKIQGGSQ